MLAWCYKHRHRRNMQQIKLLNRATFAGLAATLVGNSIGRFAYITAKYEFTLHTERMVLKWRCVNPWRCNADWLYLWSSCFKLSTTILFNLYTHTCLFVIEQLWLSWLCLKVCPLWMVLTAQGNHVGNNGSHSYGARATLDCEPSSSKKWKQESVASYFQDRAWCHDLRERSYLYLSIKVWKVHG